MTKYFLQRLWVVGLENEEGTVGREGEGVGKYRVERTLPPRGESGVIKGPLEAGGGDAGAGVEGEKGDLLAGKTLVILNSEF